MTMPMTHFDLYQDTKTGSWDVLQRNELSKSNWIEDCADISLPSTEYKPSAWNNACFWGEQAPHHPPVIFTDKSIVPVVVRINDPTNNTSRSAQNDSLSKRVKSVFKQGKERGSRIKVIEMPKREYLKHFARDGKGDYMGTETERDWTEEELDLNFSEYKCAGPRNWITAESARDVFIMEENGTI